MEPLSIGAALASANHLKGLLTGLAQGIKAAGKAEVTNQFIDLQIAMGDVLQRVRDLEDDNRRLRDEADVRSKLKYASPIYVLEGCGNADGSYCQVWRGPASGSSTGSAELMLSDPHRPVGQTRFKPITSMSPG
jgi:hypothetical protein